MIIYCEQCIVSKDGSHSPNAETILANFSASNTQTSAGQMAKVK